MNERIEQLIEQADNLEILPDELNFSTDYLCDIDPRRVKKFAELIVRECTLQVADVRIENDFEPVADVALVKAMQNIRNFFGVEE